MYLPGAGWIGLDPTSGLLAGEGHIPLACTPEPSAAAPISGAVDECETEFEHRMSVQRASGRRRASPSPTAMQSGQPSKRWAARWTRILKRLDVRLTMGGEPTFVSIDDPDGAGMEHGRAGPEETQAWPRICTGG